MAWPTDPLTVETTFALGADLTADPGTWSFSTDITTYTFDRDGDNSITISRGRADENSQTPPCETNLVVNNTDGRFSPRNPTGAYYGSLRRNTPIRVRVNPGSGLDTRNVAFTSELPPRWDPSEADHFVPIQAHGVLRRLGQGRSPLKSAVFRHVTGLSDFLGAEMPPLLEYWSLEDGEGSAGFASALGGGTIPVDADVEPASSSEIPGSAALPLVSTGGTVRGQVRPYRSTGTVRFAGLLTIPEGGLADGQKLLDATFESGSFARCAVRYGTGGSLNVQILNTAGTMIDETGAVGFAVNGSNVFLSVLLTQDGGDVDLTEADVFIFRPGVTTFSGFSPDTFTGQTLGRVTTTGFAADRGVDGAAVGHLMFTNDASQFTGMLFAPTGFNGELAGDRFARLCTEEAVPYDLAAGSTEAMGPQGIKTLLDLLRECEATEEGLLVERITGELGFDPHVVRENQTVALTLNYASGHVSPPLEPTDDDQRIRNDVTVTRDGGASAQVVDQTGPLGVDAVGRYDEGVNLSLYTDGQAAQHAGWRVNLGTADFLRFPTVTVNLRVNTSLTASFLALDIGSRIQITNLPDHISYDDVDLIVEGYTEQISQKNWIITFNCAPYRPYAVFELADTTADADPFVGRLAGDDAAIRVAIDDNDTSIVFDPNRYRWTTVADDFDPDLRVRFGGETADISTISTTPATFVAAGAASHADNAAVTPAMYAGATTGDGIFVLARFRSLGTLVTPTGYTLLGQVAYLYLWMKVHDGSESDPTVTPSGGSANEPVSAFTFGLRGTPTTLTDLADIVVDSATKVNSSAQDIAYPGLYPRYQEGCVLLLVAGKHDDWTSVAPPSGFTEIAEPDTTTWNDQGLYAAYQIQTTPAVANDGSIVVTGGVAEVSESMLLAVAAGYQTMTVSARSVNGVVKSHGAGTRIEVENAFVLGL